MQTRLPFFGVVRVSGEDRASFLHGQLSNDINHLNENSACYATYNTPKGRVLANMIVLNRGEDLLLIMAQDLTEAIVKRLRMFVLRAKVIFEPLPDFAVAGELDETASPSPAAEPALSFPAQADNGVYTITLPHSGRLKSAKPGFCPNMTRQPKTLGTCTKSAAATLGFRRQPKKLPLPKCSTNTSSAAYISKKAAILDRKSSPAPNIADKSNAGWRFCGVIRWKPQALPFKTEAKKPDKSSIPR